MNICSLTKLYHYRCEGSDDEQDVWLNNATQVIPISTRLSKTSTKRDIGERHYKLSIYTQYHGKR